eukprot:2776569-Amphidinium_carterae.1
MAFAMHSAQLGKSDLHTLCGTQRRSASRIEAANLLLPDQVVHINAFLNVGRFYATTFPQDQQTDVLGASNVEVHELHQHHGNKQVFCDGPFANLPPLANCDVCARKPNKEKDLNYCPIKL